MSSQNFIGGGLNTLSRLGKTGISSLLSSFLSQGCAVCDRPSPQPFCTDCQRQLLSQIKSNRSKSLSPTTALPLETLSAYDGTLKRAILALKYENRPEVAQLLGTELGRRWAKRYRHSHAGQRLYALPIPLHQERQQQRGYNQAALLARSFCQTSGLTLLENGLMRSQATVPQHQLGLQARQQNLEGVFEIGKSLAQRQQKHSLGVVIVDDIYTTGATVQSAAEVLSQAGISAIGVAAVARA